MRTLIVAMLLGMIAARDARAQIGTTFTYQGTLNHGGAPAAGSFDFEFSLWDSASAGIQQGVTISYDVNGEGPVGVAGGLFTADLDFGPGIFDGAPRWLQIAVRPEDPMDIAPYTALSPRVELKPVPYAFYSGSAASVSGDAISSTTQIADGAIEAQDLAAGLRNTLDAADGDPAPAVYVDDEGKVGVGSVYPSAGLHVRAKGSSAPGSSRPLSVMKDGIGGFDLLEGAGFVFTVGNIAYITGDFDGALSIVDVSNPATPVLLGQAVHGSGFTHLSNARRVFVEGDVAYVVSGGGAQYVTLIDVSDPGAPVQLSVLQDGVGGIADISNIEDIFVVNDRLYLTADAALMIVDVTNPAAPALLGQAVNGVDVTMMNTPIGLHVTPPYAYVTSYANDSFLVLNVSDPANVHAETVLTDGTGGFNEFNFIRDLHVDGRYCYVLSYLDNALTILDLMPDPSSPQLVATVKNGVGAFTEMGQPFHVISRGDRVYVSGNATNAVTVIDVSNPASPVLAEVWKNGSGEFADLSGPRAVGPADAAILVAAYNSDAVTVVGSSPGGLGLEIEGDTLLRGRLRDTTGQEGQPGQLLASTGDGTAWEDVPGDLASLLAQGNDGGGENMINLGNVELGGILQVKDGTQTLILRADAGQNRVQVDVGGTGHFSDAIYLGDTSSSANEVIMLGDVGIGVHVPSAKLDVNGTVKATAFTGNGSGLGGVHNTSLALNGMNLQLTDAGGTVAADLSPLAGTLFGDGHSLDASDGDPIDAVFVNSRGETGIGNTSPYAALHVGPDGGTTVPLPTEAGAAVHGVGGVTALEFPEDFVISGGRAYVLASAGFEDRLTVLDLSNPTAPVQTASLTLGDGMSGGVIAVSGSRACVAADGEDNVFEVIDISNPSMPVLNGFIMAGATNSDWLRDPRDIVLSGAYAFVAATTPVPMVEASFTVVDLSNPSAPAVAGRVFVSGPGFFANSIAVTGNMAYMTVEGPPFQSSSGLLIIDLTNPLSPSVLNTWSTGIEGANGLHVVGGRAYVAGRDAMTFTDSLFILDVADPLMPAVLGTATDGQDGITGLEDIEDVFVSGSIAYVTSRLNDTLTLIDVSDPASPRHLSTVSDGTNGVTHLDAPSAISLSGGRAYVSALGDDSLTVFEFAQIPGLGMIVEDSTLLRADLDVSGTATVGTDLDVSGTFRASGGGTDRFIVNGSGLVGIGTSNPSRGKLDIQGQAGSNSLSYGYLNSAGNTGTSSGGALAYSIYASGRIAAVEFNAHSDDRMKQVLGVSSGAEDLERLMGIEVTDYTLVDTVEHGTEPQKKIVAQQVEGVLPSAVHTSTNVVPDVYRPGRVAAGRVRAEGIGEIVPPLAPGDSIRLITESTSELYEVAEVDANSFRVTGGIPDGEVFVYGRLVDDFRSVDYQAISMLNVSATQELFRTIKRLREENDAAVTALRDRVEQLEADRAADR